MVSNSNGVNFNIAYFFIYRHCLLVSNSNGVNFNVRTTAENISAITVSNSNGVNFNPLGYVSFVIFVGFKLQRSKF